MNDQPLELCPRQQLFSQTAQARQCLLSKNNTSRGHGSNIISLSKRLASGVPIKIQMSSKYKK